MSERKRPSPLEPIKCIAWPSGITKIKYPDGRVYTYTPTYTPTEFVGLQELELQEAVSLFENKFLTLPSTQRLRDISQHGIDFVFYEAFLPPQYRRLWEERTSRYQHTVDLCDILLDFIKKHPRFIIKFCQEYQFDNFSQAVLHLLEVCRLHDIATLAFNYPITDEQGEKIDENTILIGALEGDERFSWYKQRLMDETASIYSEHGIDPKKILQLLKERHQANTLVGQLLNFFDWLAYTARDWTNVTDLLGFDYQTASETVVQKALEELSIKLSRGIEPKIKPRGQIPEDISKIVRPKIKIIKGKIIEVKNLERWIKRHQILRKLFTGSPWVRGSYYQIHSLIKRINDLNSLIQILTLIKRINDPNSLIQILTTRTEREIFNFSLDFPLILSIFQYWYDSEKEEPNAIPIKIEYKNLSYLGQPPPNKESYYLRRYINPDFPQTMCQELTELDKNLIRIVSERVPSLLPFLDRRNAFLALRTIEALVEEAITNNKERLIFGPFELQIKKIYLPFEIFQIVKALRNQEGIICFLHRGAAKSILSDKIDSRFEDLITTDPKGLLSLNGMIRNTLYTKLREHVNPHSRILPLKQAVRTFLKKPDLDFVITSDSPIDLESVYAIIRKFVKMANEIIITQSTRRPLKKIDIGFNPRYQPKITGTKEPIIPRRLSLAHFFPFGIKGNYPSETPLPWTVYFIQEPLNSPLILLIPGKSETIGVSIKLRPGAIKHKTGYEIADPSFLVYLFPEITFSSNNHQEAFSALFMVERYLKLLAWENRTPIFPFGFSLKETLKNILQTLIPEGSEGPEEEAGIAAFLSLLYSIAQSLAGNPVNTFLRLINEEHRKKLLTHLPPDLPYAETIESLGILETFFPELTPVLDDLQFWRDLNLKEILDTDKEVTFAKFLNLIYEKYAKDNPYVFLCLLRPAWFTRKRWLTIIFNKNNFNEISRKFNHTPYFPNLLLTYPLRVNLPKIKNDAEEILNSWGDAKRITQTSRRPTRRGDNLVCAIEAIAFFSDEYTVMDKNGETINWFQYLEKYLPPLPTQGKRFSPIIIRRNST